MLRLTNTFINLTKDVLCTNMQFIRWRKPRWLPTAKSKLFKVPPRTVIPVEEQLELARLYNNYHTQMKSVRKYLSSKYRITSSARTDIEEQMRAFETDYARCVEINNKWNESQKVLREKDAAQTLEADLDFARKRIEQELLKQERKLQEVEEIVRAEKEQSKSYITSENIDAAIEQALANPVDYNFAINLNGEKVFGRENSFQEIKEKASVSQ